MQRRSPAIVVAACARSAVVAWAATVAAAESRITVVSMPTAPRVDGVVGPAERPDEWAAAVRLEGLLANGSLEPRRATTWIGADREHLYVAMRSELPPGGRLVTDAATPDENTVLDDSVEILVDPHRRRRLAEDPGDRDGAADLPYYQIAINDQGVVLDAAFRGGAADAGWSLAGHRWQSRVNAADGTWDCELAIPWTALDADGAGLFAAGAPRGAAAVGLLVSRNWKRPWAQATAMPITGGFANPPAFAGLDLVSAGPVVQEIDLHEPFRTPVDYELAIALPEADRAAAPVRLVCTAHVASSDMPAVDDVKTVEVTPGAPVRYRFTTPPGHLHTTSEHELSVRIEPAEGAANGPGGEPGTDRPPPLFARTLRIAPARERTWDPAPEEVASDLWIAYYPSANRLAVRLDRPAAAGTTAASVEVVDSRGGRVFTGELPLAAAGGERAFTIPDLSDGTYTVRVTQAGIGDPSAAVAEKSFERAHYPWEAERLGLGSAVPTPFEPVRVAGDRVTVVGRCHAMNGFGLWSSIECSGTELLAAPMALDAATAAGPVAWRAPGGRFTAVSPDAAEHDAAAESDAVRVRTRSRIEIDGCMRVEMTLAPGVRPEPLERLWLTIPLRDQEAPLFHAAMAGSIRMNPAGAMPAGRGRIWDSTRMGHGGMLGTFVPYLWAGGPARGLAWFADNDRGWSVADDAPQIVLVREDGRLVVQVRLIDRATVIEGERTIVFGLQAAPVKPRAAGWRTAAAQRMPVHGGSNGYWGIVPTFAGKYPAGRDYAFADALAAARRSGRVDEAFVARWADEKYRSQKAWAADLVNDRVTHAAAGMAGAAGAGDRPLVLYFEEHFQDQTTPEWRVFQDEWGVRPYTPRAWLSDLTTVAESYAAGARLRFAPSYQNFALHHAREWFRRGVGVYCDNCFLHPCRNPLTSAAYVRPDGRIQPSAEIWALRDYHKRLWLLKEECQRESPQRLIVNLHMTNANLLPVIGWADASLANEWSYKNGTEPWPVENVLVEMTGLQAGNVGLLCLPFLSGVFEGTSAVPADVASPEEGRRRAAIAEWGFRRVHEILAPIDEWRRNEPWALEWQAHEAKLRDFGYGDDGCEVITYWDGAGRAGGPVPSCSNPAVKFLGLVKPATGEVLLLLVNWSREPQEAVVTVPGAEAEGKPGDAAEGPAAARLRLPGWAVDFQRFRAKSAASANNPAP